MGVRVAYWDKYKFPSVKSLLRTHCGWGRREGQVGEGIGRSQAQVCRGLPKWWQRLDFSFRKREGHEGYLIEEWYSWVYFKVLARLLAALGREWQVWNLRQLTISCSDPQKKWLLPFCIGPIDHRNLRRVHIDPEKGHQFRRGVCSAWWCLGSRTEFIPWFWGRC